MRLKRKGRLATPAGPSTFLILMPKRSNDFQRLVVLIQRAFASRAARVTESAMVETPGGFGFREIDVLIDEPSGQKRIKIAVEAKDEKRKMNVIQLESYIGKYRSRTGIPVDRVVIVTRRGFTKGAVKRAAAEAIETVLLREAKKITWDKPIPTELLLEMKPTIAGFEFDPPLDVDTKSFIREAHLICKCCGKDHGTPLMLANFAMTDAQLLRHLRESLQSSNGRACVRPQWSFRENQYFRFHGQAIALKKLVVHVHAAKDQASLKLQQYEYGDHPIHHLSGEVGGRTIDFVLTHGVDSKNIPVRVHDPCESKTGKGVPAEQSVVDLVVPEGQFVSALNKLQTAAQEANWQTFRPGKIESHQTGATVRCNLGVQMKGAGQVFVTAIFCAPAADTSVEYFRKLYDLQTRVKVVRIIVVVLTEVTEDLERTAKDYGISLIRSDTIDSETNLSQLLLPRLWGYCATSKIDQLKIYAAESFDTAEPSAMRVGGTAGRDTSLLDVLQKLETTIVEAVADNVRQQSLRARISRELEVPFAIQFERGDSLIAASGKPVRIYAIRGVALASIRAGVLTAGEVNDIVSSRAMPLTANWSVERAAWNGGEVILDYSKGTVLSTEASAGAVVTVPTDLAQWRQGQQWRISFVQVPVGIE